MSSFDSGADEGERRRTEWNWNNRRPSAKRNSSAAGSGVGDDVDLPIRKPKSSVISLRRAVLRLGIRADKLRRTGLENHVAMRRICDFA